MTAPSQVDGADLIDLLESDDIKTVTATQALINENLQNGIASWFVREVKHSEENFYFRIEIISQHIALRRKAFVHFFGRAASAKHEAARC